jgi:hypothetical protein
MRASLLSGVKPVRGLVVIGLVVVVIKVAVKHRKTDEEGQADQILNPFDVLVKVNQGVDLMEFADLSEQLVHHDVTSLMSEVAGCYLSALAAER